jgi:hypothetical protein
VTVEAIWHRQCEADRGVTWLRSQIEAATEGLRQGATQEEGPFSEGPIRRGDPGVSDS